ncbi:MAG: DNA mismatch repair protein MutS, partial [Clostridia bacterium]|nr:DNA mismatch repair protein MutS [Clostridia bacterium]
SNAIATLDTLISLAKVATQNNYCKPKLNTANTLLDIKNGRHPIVEKSLKNNSFTPNDVKLNTEDMRTMILTGPNMAGKSTYMRQTALIVFMTHIGSFVPATEATVPLTDKIFTRVGASDELAFNHSTFMVEMSEVSYILNNATEKSLIILDEVGRGTATFDGLSIAWAIMEYITSKIKAKTLFATHYHELTELEGRIEGIVNYNVAIKEINNSIVFLHKILPGGASKSFGIEVAKLAGIPDEITDKAKAILKKLEKTNLNKNVFDPAQIKAEEEKQQQQNKKYTKICTQLKNLDVNTVSPLIAFDILCNLKKELTNEE